MHPFTDSAGRKWQIDVDVLTRKRVLDDTQVDLFGAIDGSLQAKLAAEPHTLVAVLFSLISEQAEKIPITPEQFARSITGDVLDEASEAMGSAIADFFPSRQRQVMRASLAKGREIAARATDLMLAKIEAMSLDELLRTSSDSSISSAASSDSPPTA